MGRAHRCVTGFEVSRLPITSLDEGIERLYELNVERSRHWLERHERPHKPVLLLAVLDLIATGEADPDRVQWWQRLRQRFAPYFDVVRKNDDQNTPENPLPRLPDADLTFVHGAKSFLSRKVVTTTVFSEQPQE